MLEPALLYLWAFASKVGKVVRRGAIMIFNDQDREGGSSFPDKSGNDDRGEILDGGCQNSSSGNDEPPSPVCA
jgi:hypothetical protein